jgi:hypothetical protein
MVVDSGVGSHHSLQMYRDSCKSTVENGKFKGLKSGIKIQTVTVARILQILSRGFSCHKPVRIPFRFESFDCRLSPSQEHFTFFACSKKHFPRPPLFLVSSRILYLFINLKKKHIVLKVEEDGGK